LNISTQFSSFSATPATTNGIAKAPETPPDSSSQPTAITTQGVKVSLSEAGIQKSADTKKPESNDDIDSSGLPDQTQKTLKMIRELKQKIEEKQQELKTLMADERVDPELKKSQLGALLATISTLTAGLATANNALEKQAKSGKISADQLGQAKQLAAK
jgi:hypothetical protein